MKFELNRNNNSKKLIIGVSIIFCTVILIIGGTIAFFTQSDSEDTGNIVTVDKVELEYIDDFDENKNYMRQELIPASIDNVIKAYTREDTQNKCLDSQGRSACSVYKFSIKNIRDITQELKMTLNPTTNTYTNLKFLLYEITENENKQIMSATELIKESKTAIPLYNSFMLKSNEERTFEIIFYIEAKDYDQTEEDAGKVFGAGIRVDSITTGTYVAKNFGESCWTISGNTLTAFNGIDSNGEPKAECSGYVQKGTDGYYSIYIPSNIGGQQITTLGNTLFFGFDQTGNLNNYSKINNIEIEEGITTIKDGFSISSTASAGTFTGVGVDEVDLSTFTIKKQHDVNIVLPSTLESIGSFSFALTGNKTISFNEKDNKSKLNNIGAGSFMRGSIESIAIPSSLKTIGEDAFFGSNLESINILSNVETVGNYAFDSSIIGKLTISGDIENLGIEVFDKTTINHLVLEEGVTTISNYLFHTANITMDENNPLIIPKSVTEIGARAFRYNKFKKLIFAGSEDDSSNLTTIGDFAFNSVTLSYLTKDDPLIIPASVTSIGNAAFAQDAGYEKTLSFIKYMGNRTAFDSLNKTTAWFSSYYTYAKPLEEYDNE